MTILITGATGYIGGQMARYLASKGEDIICLTRKNKTVDSIPVVHGDLLESETLSKACKGIDIVCHFAGALGRGLTDENVHAINVDGLHNLMLAAKQNNVKYFLHISSAAVTGPMGPTPATEITECSPFTIYERTKLKGEQLALSLAREIGLPLGIARPTFTYGPGDPHKLLMFKLIKKRMFFYIGDGNSTNHPVYIDDLIDGIMLMIKQQPIQKVFILGGNNPVTKKEWAITVAKTIGVTPPFIYLPSKIMWIGAVIMETIGRWIGMEVPLTRSRIMAMSKYWGMDISKAKRELGYNPKVGFKEGVARTVSWYMKRGLL